MSARVTGEHRARLLCALGVTACVLAVYLVTGVGRIDIIDGQVRYDVAASWLDAGEPMIRDRALAGTSFATRTERGTFANYNAGGSVSSMPLMLVSRLVPGHTVERDRFVFSLTGAFFGAAVAGVLVIGYGMLGVGAASAVAWALVTAFATLWWPGSVTTFDQNQHAFFLLTALLLAWHSARAASGIGWAALAGLVGGVLLSYQELYLLLLPFVGLAVFASPEATFAARQGWRAYRIDAAATKRYLVFAAGCAVGLLAFIAFNVWRFGAMSPPSRYDNPLWFSGHAIAGLLSLGVSPGKSIVLFSPPVLLAIAGGARAFARARMTFAAVVLISIVYVLLIVQFPFFGGDWCWGPRYLLVVLPLWALAFPFSTQVVGRRTAGALVAAGLVVQLMAITVDHQRFFFAHDLGPYFWRDQWTYFKHSQIVARPGELVSLVRDGVPADARWFSPTPQAQITYTPAGPPRDRRPSEWMRQFAVFYLPRPWPAWVPRLDPAHRPIAPWPMLALCGALLAAGLTLIARETRRAPRPVTGEVRDGAMPMTGR